MSFVENDNCNTDYTDNLRYIYFPSSLVNHLTLDGTVSRGALGRGGLVGEHMFYCLYEKDTLGEQLCVLAYAVGILSFNDLHALLGELADSSLRSALSRLVKKGALASVFGGVSYRSDMYYVPNYEHPVFKRFVELGVLPPVRYDLVSSRMLSHCYGVSLAVLQMRLFCMVYPGYSISDVRNEHSLWGSSVTSRSSSAVTADSYITYHSPLGKRGIFLEFDTGSESLPVICRKFHDYSMIDLYSSEGILPDKSCILFSVHEPSVKANRFIKSFDLAKAIRLCAHIFVGLAIQGISVSDIMHTDIIPLVASSCGSLFFYENYRGSSVLPGYDSLMGKALSPLASAMQVLVLNSLNFSSALRIRGICLPDEWFSDAVGTFTASERLLPSDVRELMSFTDYFSCDGSSLVPVLPFGAFVSFIKNLPSDYKTLAVRRDYNRGCYSRAFTRHISFARAFIKDCIGQTQSASSKNSEAHSLYSYLPMLEGYDVFAVPNHLLGNYLSDISSRDMDAWHEDSLFSVIPRVCDAYGYHGVCPTAFGMSKPYHISIGITDGISIRLRRGFHLDGRCIYLLDGTCDTSSLVRASLLYAFYKGDEGMFDIVITVNSVPEALKIKEQIFGKSSLSSLGLSLPAFNSSFPVADCHIMFILKNDPAEGYFAGEFLCV